MLLYLCCVVTVSHWLHHVLSFDSILLRAQKLALKELHLCYYIKLIYVCPPSAYKKNDFFSLPAYALSVVHFEDQCSHFVSCVCFIVSSYYCYIYVWSCNQVEDSGLAGKIISAG